MAGRTDERWLASWRGPQSFTSWLTFRVPDTGTVEQVMVETEASIERVREDLIALCNDLATVHSLRLVPTPALEYENQAPGVLFNVVHDETDATIVDRLAPMLHQAIGGGVGAATPEELVELLHANELRHHTMFIANINVTVQDVWDEHALYQFLQQELDTALNQGSVTRDSTPEEIRRLLRTRVATDPDLPQASPPEVSAEGRGRRFRDLLVTFLNPGILGLISDVLEAVRHLDTPRRWLARLLLVPWALVALVFLIPAGLALILIELTEEDVDTGAPTAAELDEIEDREDRFSKNAVTLLWPVKHSSARRFIMHRILSQAEQGSRHFWTRGKLTGIETIQYARLFLTHSRRTMVFMSDYDGALDRYLDDFLGVGQTAVVPISSSVHGCPPTLRMRPRDMTVFRRRWRVLIRRHQQLESFWYSAYRDLDTDQIRNHRFVRQGLFAESLDTEAVNRWLRRL